MIELHGGLEVSGEVQGCVCVGGVGVRGVCAG